MTPALGMPVALFLDAMLGEPRRYHPLVGFGRFAIWVETKVHADARAAGALAWCTAVLAPVGVFCVLRAALPAAVVFAIDVSVACLAIGRRSLADHARPVARALSDGDLDAARRAVGRMVSRDTEVLDAGQVAAATTESVLENGHDAVFGALFWFALLGGPGVMLFRLANTLDAMWGYRTPRYERFGWVAARADDLLGYVPARLTALTYACVGDFAKAIRCWRRQAPSWDSPNAGPVMASGAGALGVRLGGAAPYHGRWEERPVLGEGEAAVANDILRALRLVDRGAVVWAAIAIAIAIGVAAHA